RTVIAADPHGAVALRAERELQGVFGDHDRRHMAVTETIQAGTRTDPYVAFTVFEDGSGEIGGEPLLVRERFGRPLRPGASFTLAVRIGHTLHALADRRPPQRAVPVEDHSLRVGSEAPAASRAR